MDVVLIANLDNMAKLQRALDFMTDLNVDVIRQKHLPHPYEAGLKYARQPRGRERWFTADQVVKLHGSDCKNLAAYLAAYLRVSGKDPGARATVYRASPTTWHCVVNTQGRILDPSKTLGMK